MMCYLYKFANYTAWEKWWLEKKNHEQAPKLAAYTPTQSISHTSHQSGHDSLSPIDMMCYCVTLEKRCYGWMVCRVQHGFHGKPQCITATFVRLDKKLVTGTLCRHSTTNTTQQVPLVWSFLYQVYMWSSMHPQYTSNGACKCQS